MKYIPKKLPEGINAGKDRPLLDLWILLGALIALTVGLYFAAGWSVDWIAQRIPPKIENRISTWIHMEEWALRTPANVSLPLEPLFNRLVKEMPASPWTFKLHVACSSNVNAYALPGGHIVVESGLLQAVRSENELAVVLGHELGHVFYRDHLRRMGRALVWLTIASFLGFDGESSNAQPVTVQGAEWLNLQFSQEQESAADRMGAKLVYKIYGHAGGITDFFETLEEERPSFPAERWISTHPPSKERTAALQALIREQGWQKKKVVPWKFDAALCEKKG